MAGLIPGLMLALGFAVVIFGWARINPEIGPAGARFTWRSRLETVPAVIWPIVIFLIIIGGLLKGFFTPTEAGSIGTLAVLVLSMAKRDLNFGGITHSIREALATSCMIMLLVAGSIILGHFIAVTDIPDLVVRSVQSLPFHRHIVMILIFIFFVLGGSFIDDLAFCVLATPIFFPAIIKLGYDPLWACIMLAMTVCVGAVIPPVAICVFVVKNVTKVPMSTIYAGCYPFLISLFICIALLFIFPELATYLPSMMK